LPADGSNRLFVDPSRNYRVMVFDVATITDGEAAIDVLGQTSFTCGREESNQGSGLRLGRIWPS